MHAHACRHPIRVLAAILALGTLLGGCTRSNISDRKIDYISLTQAVDLYEQQQRDGDTALFIDARSPDRYAQAHIPGARNLRTPDIDLRYDPDPALTRFDNLIIYGENPGTASVNAMAKQMIEAGYNSFIKRRVKVFLGGWREWEITGLPIEEPQPAQPADQPAQDQPDEQQ